MSDDKLDQFHEHEALHTAHVVLDLWTAQVQEHPWVASHQNLTELAEKASAAMMALYQAIGADND